jgi:RNA recognition motif-containing protein
MSTQYTRSSGRRSGRGPRRQNRNREDDRPGRSSQETRSSAPKAPEKKSLWQKIVAFFSPKKAGTNGSSRPQSRTSTPAAVTTSNYPASAPAPRQSRKPEAVEVTSAKVYVGNLSFDAAEADLRELFNGVGAVQTAEIVTHSHTQKSKGFGFVTLATVEEAKRAVEVLHDKEFMGRKLVVSGAKTPVDRR